MGGISRLMLYGARNHIEMDKIDVLLRRKSQLFRDSFPIQGTVCPTECQHRARNEQERIVDQRAEDTAFVCVPSHVPLQAPPGWNADSVSVGPNSWLGSNCPEYSG